MASKSKVIHRSKLFQGRRSAEEIHAKFGFGKGCLLCGQPGVIRIRVLIQHDELVRRAPDIAAAIAASNPDGPFIPTFATSYGPMVRVSETIVCRFHRREVELAAAKGPSWAFIEIDRGPGSDRPQVGAGS